MKGSLLAVFCLGLAVSAARGAGFAETDGLLIEYDFRSDGPVYTDPTPLLRVFGDGRLEVAIPYFRKRAGFYQGRLSQAELDALLTDLESSGVLALDAGAVAAAKAAARARVADDVHVHRSETETTRMAFALAGAKTLRTRVWRNLRFDEQRYGKHADELAALWQADRQLHALTEHRSLKRVRGEAVPGGYLR